MNLTDLMDELRRGQEAVRRATARCEWEIDPKVPGRKAWRISGHARVPVEHAIACRLEDAADAGGRGTFLGPYGDGDGGFIAFGETIVPVPA